MVKLLFWKMLRDMRKSFSAYLVAVLIVATGFAGYSVLSVAVEQLTQSRDYFFKATSFSDAFAEVQEAPASVTGELEKIPGIQRAQGRLVQNIRVAGLDQQAELRVFSTHPQGLNLPLLSRGINPMPGEKQVILGDGFYDAHGFQLGDTVELVVAGRKNPLTITGSGLSPENIYLLRNLADMLPDPSNFDAAFMDYQAMSRLLSKEGRVNNLVMTLEPGVAFSQVEDAVKTTLAPYGCYRVYERKDEASVAMLEMELEQVGKMTTVIPFLFLSISSVVLYITMHRLIQQQRTQIGTLLAMGIPNRIISLHYMGYGGFVGFAGGLAGGIYGSLAAAPMADFYRIYFSLPKVSQPVSLRYLALGTLAATLFCGLVGWISARACGKLAPAEALRPAPPKAARRSFLEYIPGFAHLLTVPGLMAVRSIARNRRRSILSMLGIACAYMITASLVSMNSLFDVFLFDALEKNQQQDITVSFSAPIPSHTALAALRSTGISQMEGIVELPVTIRGQQDEVDCVIQGIPVDSSLCRLYDEQAYPLFVQPEGIVLSRHTADLLGVAPGSLVEVETSYPKTRISWVRVTGIAAQYIGNTAYMSHKGVGRISDYRNVYTSVLLKAPPGTQGELIRQLDDATAVSAIQSRLERLETTRSMMGLIGVVMGSMVVMGVAVGFAVIYTGALISFEELKREVATMRMLGVSDKLCLDTVSTGQWLLTCGGVILGIPMTMGISRLMSISMALELFSIPDFVDWPSLLLSIGLTLIAVALSNQAVYRKLRRLTPVELLRERE